MVYCTIIKERDAFIDISFILINCEIVCLQNEIHALCLHYVDDIYSQLAASPRRRGVQSLRDCGSAY